MRTEDDIKTRLRVKEIKRFCKHRHSSSRHDKVNAFILRVKREINVVTPASVGMEKRIVGTIGFNA